MTATLRMFNAFFPPLLSGEAHHGTILCVSDLAQPRKLVVVVDNHHPKEAVLLQRIAHLSRPWKPIRHTPSSARDRRAADTIPLNIATASSQPRRNAARRTRRASASTCAGT